MNRQLGFQLIRIKSRLPQHFETIVQSAGLDQESALSFMSLAQTSNMRTSNLEGASYGS